MADMKLFLQLLANSSGLRTELTNSGRAVNRFTATARKEFDALKGALGSVEGKLASIGVSIGAVQTVMASARLDKSLTQVGQTAGVGREMVQGLRKELFAMGRESGRDIEELKAGFDGLVQSGQSWKAALESSKGINIATAVTGANAAVLSRGLTVGASAFNIDLEKPGKALELLDKMTAAGRLGSAELENLSDIFARVGVNAASANMGFDKTLAFIEGLSAVEKDADRLGTLADSTLRLFTNLKYMADAQNGTGVKFFDAKGGRRDPVAVLKDIKAQYDKLKTDKDRALFIQKGFGKADLDTIKGLRTLLDGDALSRIDEFTAKIGGAGGTLKRDMDEATRNLVDQAGRLKIVMREAADGFVQPITQTMAEFIQFMLDKKSNGGWELSGKELIGSGAALGLGTFLAARYGSKGIASLAGKLLNGGGSLAVGVAEGKALQVAAGVTPVFVTNMPGTGIPGAGAPGVPTPPPALPRLPQVPAWLGGSGVLAGLTLGLPTSFYLSSKSRENGWGGWGGSTGPTSQAQRQVMGIAPAKNDIKIDVHIDGQGNSTVKTYDMNSFVAVKSRGDFFAGKPDL